MLDHKLYQQLSFMPREVFTSHMTFEECMVFVIFQSLRESCQNMDPCG